MKRVAYWISKADAIDSVFCRARLRATVVSRLCLDILRSRKSRREEPIAAQVSEASVVRGEGADPESEAVLADSVGVALLVVLETLASFSMTNRRFFGGETL